MKMSESGNPENNLNSSTREEERISAEDAVRKKSDMNVFQVTHPVYNEGDVAVDDGQTEPQMHEMRQRMKANESKTNHKDEIVDVKKLSKAKSKASSSVTVLCGIRLVVVVIAILIVYLTGGENDDNKISPGLEAIKLTQKTEDFPDIVADEKEVAMTEATEKNVKGYSHTREPEEWERISEIQDILKKPLKEIGFLRSSKLLQELQKLRGFEDFDSLLQRVECEVHLGRGKEDESTRRVKDFISSSESYSVDYALGLAIKLTEKKSFVRALILLRVAYDLFEPYNVSPDDAVAWIGKLIILVSNSAQPLIKAGGTSREIGIKYGFEFSENMLNVLRMIINATPEHKALQQANCIVSVTATCSEASLFQKAIRYGKEGVSVLENRFGMDASKHRSYGSLLNNLGANYYRIGRYTEAKQYLLRAVEAKRNALDFANENEKHNSIELSKYVFSLVN